MLTIEEIYQFIEGECSINAKKLLPCSDINEEFGVEGDDFEELMLAYSNKFKVNISSYLWYFHSSEEGISLFSFLFQPPNKRVTKIAVTPKLLLDCARSKIWSVNYPDHVIPQKRWDIIFSRVFWGLCTIVTLALIIIKS